jgi:hypothetical protein
MESGKRSRAGRRVIEELVKAIAEYRKSGGDHHAVHALNKALERAELLLSSFRHITARTLKHQNPVLSKRIFSQERPIMNFDELLQFVERDMRMSHV